MDTGDQEVTQSGAFPGKKDVFWILAVIIIAFMSGIMGYNIGLHAGTTKISEKTVSNVALSHGPTIVPSHILTPAVTLSPSLDTPGWKTYSNATFGATFRYPSDWLVVTDKWQEGTPVGQSYVIDLEHNAPKLGYSGDESIFIGFQVFSSIIQYDESYPMLTGNPNAGNEFAYKSLKNPNGVIFQRAIAPSPVFTPTSADYELLVEHNNKVYSIGYQHRLDAQKNSIQNYDAAFNQIVSTFQFIQ